jgi:hypothetical protein
MNRRIHSLLCLCFLVLVLITTERTSYAKCGDPQYLWAKRVGGTTSDAAYGLATDVAGSVFITGFDLGTVDFGGGPIPNAGQHDVFLAKFNSAGAHVWSKGFGSTGNEWGRAVTVDASANVFITGFFQGTVNFGGSNLVSNAGTSDVFLAKYDNSGIHLWSQRFGGANIEDGLSLATDASGNVFLTGYFEGTANFGGSNLISAGGEDVYLAKYNSSGVHQWSQRFGSTLDDIGKDVAVDASGNVVITGTFQNSVNFGGFLLASAGSTDVFVAKYNSNGVHQWSQRFGGTSADAGASIATDAASNVIITGFFPTTINFGGSTLTSAASTDIFLAKLNSGGTHQWSESFAGSGADSPLGVAVDASSNIAITGYISAVASGTLNLGGSTLIAAGSDDIFLGKYDSSGAHLWSMSFGTAGDEEANAVATDPSGNVLMSGSLGATISLGGAPLVGLGGTDAFVAKYSPETVPPCIQSIVDVGNDQGRQVKISFVRSGYDRPGAPVTITGYEAYRRDDPPPPVAISSSVSSSEAPPPALAGWQFVGSVPAHGESEYLLGAPTVGDSTIAHGQYYSVFYIRAVTSSPFVFYDSPPDSGYSLDNLAPGVPSNFLYNTGLLSWNQSTAKDFDYFTVYGSNTNSFAARTLLNYSVAPSMDVTSSPYVYYYVTATDFSGNEGKPAMINTLSGVGGTPKNYVLSVSNYPNPFNPRTTVSYTVPSRGHVSVAIYDPHGALVATLFNGERGAGAYSVNWDGRTGDAAVAASGIYFARIEHSSGTRTKKMVLLK